MSIQVQDYEQLDIMVRKSSQLLSQPKNLNRLYLSWKNSNGNQCKMIGPQTKCFCNHRFKEHQYLNPLNGKTLCKDKNCNCKTFQYIPTHGAYDFKCLCKHSFKQHNRISKKCQRQKCSNCTSFASAWTCSCGQKYDKHITISQTFEQRKKQGKSTNDMNRVANQLQGNLKQGSLYKPIKQDRQSRLKRYNESINQSVNYNLPSIKIKIDQIDQIEEFAFQKGRFNSVKKRIQNF